MDGGRPHPGGWSAGRLVEAVVSRAGRPAAAAGIRVRLGIGSSRGGSAGGRRARRLGLRVGRRSPGTRPWPPEDPDQQVAARRRDGPAASRNPARSATFRPAASVMTMPISSPPGRPGRRARRRRRSGPAGSRSNRNRRTSAGVGSASRRPRSGNRVGARAAVSCGSAGRARLDRRGAAGRRGTGRSTRSVVAGLAGRRGRAKGNGPGQGPIAGSAPGTSTVALGRDLAARPVGLGLGRGPGSPGLAAAGRRSGPAARRPRRPRWSPGAGRAPRPACRRP